LATAMQENYLFMNHSKLFLIDKQLMVGLHWFYNSLHCYCASQTFLKWSRGSKILPKSEIETQSHNSQPVSKTICLDDFCNSRTKIAMIELKTLDKVPRPFGHSNLMIFAIFQEKNCHWTDNPESGAQTIWPEQSNLFNKSLIKK